MRDFIDFSLTDTSCLAKLQEMVEKERKRCQQWAFYPALIKEQEIYLFRCKRLAEIRESLRMLEETYEE
jgi:hypothetical protein